MNFRTDIADNKGKNFKHIYYKDNKKIDVLGFTKNNFDYKLIYFKNISNKKALKKAFQKEITYFLNKYISKNNYHIFIVGLGNENNTADSVGPKALKYIHVNAHLKDLGVDINNPKISALEPGVLGTTGIETSSIIYNIIKLIKPDIVLFIDSFISDDVKYLDQTIQITDEGIIPGSGIKGTNNELNQKKLGIPVITVGVPTAMEYKDTTTFLISKSDIDEYIINISKLIGEGLDEILHINQ